MNLASGATEDLADYIESDAPLTRKQRMWLADFLRALLDRGARGQHGERRLPPSARTKALREVARRVVEQKASWCKTNGRKYVPDNVAAKIIMDEIARAPAQRPKIDVEDIKQALKNKR
jgi:hypothetical protein